MEENLTTGQLLKQIDNAIENRANNSLRKRNLTMSQSWVLTILNERKDRTCSLKELEEILGIAQSTCFGIIKRLVAKDFVTCFSPETNRRIKLVKITPAGRKCCSAVAEEAVETEKYIFSCLSEDEAALFHSSLQKIHAKLK